MKRAAGMGVWVVDREGTLDLGFEGTDLGDHTPHYPQ